MQTQLNRNNLLMLFLYLACLAVFTNVEALMRTATSTKEGNECLEDGYTTCRSYFNVSQTICCNPDAMDVDECAFDFEKLAFGKTQNYGMCSSQVFDPSILPYVCPFQTKICSSTPCAKLGIQGDASDPTNSEGCTFSNPKVKKACKLADK